MFVSAYHSRVDNYVCADKTPGTCDYIEHNPPNYKGKPSKFVPFGKVNTSEYNYTSTNNTYRNT